VQEDVVDISMKDEPSPTTVVPVTTPVLWQRG